MRLHNIDFDNPLTLCSITRALVNLIYIVHTVSSTSVHGAWMIGNYDQHNDNTWQRCCNISHIHNTEIINFHECDCVCQFSTLLYPLTRLFAPKMFPPTYFSYLTTQRGKKRLPIKRKIMVRHHACFRDKAHFRPSVFRRFRYFYGDLS